MGMGNGRYFGGRFSFLFVPPHKQEPFPEPLEIAVAIRRIYHGLGDVVPGLMPEDSKKELESIWSLSLNSLIEYRLMEETFFFAKKRQKLRTAMGMAKTPSPTEFTEPLFFKIFSRIIYENIGSLNMVFKSMARPIIKGGVI